jgi:FixJ family two-component response regulator
MTEDATIYLVDDDMSFLNAQSRMFRAAGFAVRTFTSAMELLLLISPETRGCVVADLSMPGMNGLELQAALARAGAVLPIVFLSGQGDIPSSVYAMRGGAMDFLEKRATQENLFVAVRRALDSDVARHAARARIVDLRKRFARLTPREREVMRHVVHGAMNKQIAARLGINERTVRMHRTSITTKLGIRSAPVLATLARDAGLFEPDNYIDRGM